MGAGGGEKPPASPREKSWTARRKETYLKRYGRQSLGTPAPDVAVSAVAFGAKLKVRAANRAAGSSTPDQPAIIGGAEGAGAVPIDVQ